MIISVQDITERQESQIYFFLDLITVVKNGIIKVKYIDADSKINKLLIDYLTSLNISIEQYLTLVFKYIQPYLIEDVDLGAKKAKIILDFYMYIDIEIDIHDNIVHVSMNGEEYIPDKSLETDVDDTLVVYFNQNNNDKIFCNKHNEPKSLRHNKLTGLSVQSVSVRVDLLGDCDNIFLVNTRELMNKFHSILNIEYLTEIARKNGYNYRELEQQGWYYHIDMSNESSFRSVIIPMPIIKSISNKLISGSPSSMQNDLTYCIELISMAVSVDEIIKYDSMFLLCIFLFRNNIYQILCQDYADFLQNKYNTDSITRYSINKNIEILRKRLCDASCIEEVLEDWYAHV